jgi:hypothetical protein
LTRRRSATRFFMSAVMLPRSRSCSVRIVLRAVASARAPFSADVVAPDAQRRERRVLFEGSCERPRASADVVVGEAHHRERCSCRGPPRATARRHRGCS